MVLLVDQFFFREICMCVYLFLIRESMIKYGCTEHSKTLPTVHCICMQAFLIRSICCVRESSRPPVCIFFNVVDGFETDPVFKYLQDTASQSCKSTKVCRHWRLSVLAMSTRCAGHVWIVDYSRDVSATIVMPKTECLRSAGAQAS